MAREDPKSAADIGIFVTHPDSPSWTDGRSTIGISTSSSDQRFEGYSSIDTIGLVQSPYKVVGSYGDDKPKEVDFLRGDFTLVQKGVRSSSVSSAPRAILFIGLDPKLAERLKSELPGTVSMEEPRTATSGLLQANYYIESIQDFLRSDGFGGSLRAECIATLLFSDIYQLIGRRSDSNNGPLCDNKIARITEYIDANMDDKIGIETLAGIASMSHFHFARVFKETTGLTPYRYVLKHRLEKVKCLLATTNKSLVEIACETGFSSQSHMSAAFQKFFGASPGRYRSEIQR